MAPLPNGTYALRPCPALDTHDVGGMYLTGESEVDGAVTVAAVGPNSEIAQNWFVTEAEGETNLYTIRQFTTGSTFSGSLSVKHHKVPRYNNEPLVTSQRPDLWVIRPVEVHGVEDAFEIIGISKHSELGVEWLVGTHHHDVVLKQLIMGEVPQHRPYWKFVKSVQVPKIRRV